MPAKQKISFSVVYIFKKDWYGNKKSRKVNKMHTSSIIG
jgi:hypothetical protein